MIHDLLGRIGLVIFFVALVLFVALIAGIGYYVAEAEPEPCRVTVDGACVER